MMICCLRASEEATGDDPDLDLFLDTLAQELGGLPPDLKRVRDSGGPPRRPNEMHRPLGAPLFAAEEVTPGPAEGRRNGGAG